ncbi:MAG: type II toxin-antitoxin system VapC family toxin [Candidatus Bathyarchaeia archaeon]
MIPLLDTVVLSAAGDDEDKRHEKALAHLGQLKERHAYIACFALIEFNVVLKSRGFNFDERMERHALLLRDFPEASEKVLPLNPSTLYLTAKLEKELGMEYFDAGVAAEALQHDGLVVSTDAVFDRVSGLSRIW